MVLSNPSFKVPSLLVLPKYALLKMSAASVTLIPSLAAKSKDRLVRFCAAPKLLVVVKSC